MDYINENIIDVKDDKLNRRGFFKQTGKYLLGFAAFGIASLLGLKHEGALHLGKMKINGMGLSEAHGMCGAGLGCSGGGGQCGAGLGCSGGGGQCGAGLGCGGGGGVCGAGLGCSGR